MLNSRAYWQDNQGQKLQSSSAYIRYAPAVKESERCSKWIEAYMTSCLHCSWHRCPCRLDALVSQFIRPVAVAASCMPSTGDSSAGAVY